MSNKRVKLDALRGEDLRNLDSKGGFILPQIENEEQKEELETKKQVMWDPPISLVMDENPKCVHCQSLDLDFVIEKHFKLYVCKQCKRDKPEMYSLLTKTECRQDYLLTQSELEDEKLLPSWIKANPHKSTWSDMYLYLRCQVEEFAFKKWKSAEELDKEFERRQVEKKEKKEKKFNDKMKELRRKTRTTAMIKPRKFHEHLFGEKFYSQEKSCHIQQCTDCGIQVEFDEF